MKKMLDETRFGNTFSGIIDTIFLGLLWMVLCLPVITIGPASAALYHTIVKSVRHERGHSISTFFGAFKSNFKSGLKAWLVWLLYAGIWAADVYALSIIDPEGLLIMSRVFRVMILPAFIPLPWLFAYISRFDNTLGTTLKYVVYLSVKNLGRTLVLLLVMAGTVLIGWLLPALIPLLPGFCCLFMSFQTEPVFKKITSAMEGDANSDQWYNE